MKEKKSLSLSKIIVSIIKLPINLIKYFCLGFFFSLYFLIDIIVSVITFFGKGLLLGLAVISRFVYLLIRYVSFGIIYPIILLYRAITQKVIKTKKQHIIDLENKAKLKEQVKLSNELTKEENKKRLAEAKKAERDAKIQEQLNKKEENVYVNENMTLEKKTLSDRFKAISDKFKTMWENSSYVKNKKNKADINRQALLLDFEGKDAEKTADKVMYKYVAKDPEGKVIKGYFPAYSKVEVHSFLLSEGNEVYSIETNKWIQMLYPANQDSNANKIKTKDLIFFCTQLSTYIKAGITLVESLKILSKQFKNKKYQRVFRSMIYDLTTGDSFSSAMDKQGRDFPRLLINMIKASEMTGELPEALDDMAEYFTEMDRTRKQMITAMIYPAIVMFVAIVAVIFMMVYVVPKFVTIYSDIDGAELPGITVFVLKLSHFLQNSYLWIILGITVFIFLFIWLFKNVKQFKTFIQYVVMHIPVFGNIIIYNEVHMFAKTFASLLSHNVFITDSMEILNKITNNEIYKELILDTITNLSKGEKVSEAFKDHWAFPIPAYEMIVTGEKTGQLPEMMDRVAKYYQEQHSNAVGRIKAFVEPAMILFLTVVVGGIVLSIVIPMFSIYNAVQSY